MPSKLIADAGISAAAFTLYRHTATPVCEVAIRTTAGVAETVAMSTSVLNAGQLNQLRNILDALYAAALTQAGYTNA